MKKVLVAEDVEIISTMITRVLEKLGIEVLVAADGEQCLAMA
jgi:CheY-like chemotaxis protein